MWQDAKVGDSMWAGAVLVFLLAGSQAGAQATWRPLPELSTRSKHRMTYDPVRDRVVLFGGKRNEANLGDTWEWDGRRWQLKRPPVSPCMVSA